MTMETIIFLLNHMLTYCITVDLGNIVLKCKYCVNIENPYYLHRACIGKINRNYPVTREVTDQGAKLVISVVAHCVCNNKTTLHLGIHIIRRLGCP